MVGEADGGAAELERSSGLVGREDWDKIEGRASAGVDMIPVATAPGVVVGVGSVADTLG